MVTLKELNELINSDFLEDDGFTLRFKAYLKAVYGVWNSECYGPVDLTEDEFAIAFGTEAYNSLMMYRLGDEEIPVNLLRYPLCKEAMETRNVTLPDWEI